MKRMNLTPGAWFGALVMGAFAVFACNSSPAPSETVGTQAEALFATGVPCSAATQCETGNCVDGVCCNTACGGGARDLQSCSNIYGVVPGLVNGTCTTLTVGNACGSLVSVNPCTWRGTTVNNGNNCPNPPGGASACFPCTGPADCSGAFPICSTAGACVACDGDNGSGSPAACPASAPACTVDGSCVQCTSTNTSACSSTTAACDLATNTCAACNGDNGSGAPRSCPTSAARACLPDGSCAACSATNATACSGTSPACDASSHTCVACNGDFGTGATAACATGTDPYCFSTGSVGSCGKCTGDGDCVGHPGGSVCNLTTGACGAACVDDTTCAAGQWCAAGACIAKTPNGQPLPNIAPINGSCTAGNGARVCQSGVCDTGDNLCGLPNGVTCGPPPNDLICRAGVCSPTDNLCGLPAGSPCTDPQDCRSNVCPPSALCGTCSTDANCGGPASGQICDDLDKTCKPGCRGTGGNGCMAGQLCTSTTTVVGSCVQCIDDTSCGSATSGQVCNPAGTCQAGCRGSGGNGCLPGQTCSSQDGTIGTCTGEADAGITDAGTDSGTDAGTDAGRDAGTDGGAKDAGGTDAGAIVDGGGITTDAGRLGDAGGTGDGSVVPVQDDGIVEGGGFSCSTTSAPAPSRAGALVALVAIALASRRRRRRY
jgi:MYXO-CTERM domain-containing protein